jgi:hypothetical protein
MELDLDQLQARLVVMEAVMFGLIEREAQQAFASGGQDAVTGLAAGLGEAVSLFSSALPPQQERLARELFAALLNTIEVRLQPAKAGAKVN